MAVGMRAGQRLVEMMMRVDEARQHDMTRGVERRVDRRRRRAAHCDEFDDARPLDDEAARGARRENGERVLDPDAHGVASSYPSLRVRTGLRPVPLDETGLPLFRILRPLFADERLAQRSNPGAA